MAMSNQDFHRGQRKQLFVDQKVQGALVVRTIGYWAFCLLSITLMLLCWRIATGPARMFYMHFDDMWFHFGPALVASLILLPMVVVDVVRMSNRFVGPMVRFRRMMKDLAAGKPVRPITLRDGDFWQDYAKDFNAVLRHVVRLSAVLEAAQQNDPAAQSAPASDDQDAEPELANSGL
jgi:hypothetical protein